MKKYEIWWAEVIFEDSEEKKTRPILILSDMAFLISAYKITSQGKTHLTQCPIKRWQEAGLEKESYIIYDKPIRLKKDKLISKIGTLHIGDIFALERIVNK